MWDEKREKLNKKCFFYSKKNRDEIQKSMFISVQKDKFANKTIYVPGCAEPAYHPKNSEQNGSTCNKQAWK